MLEVQDEDGRLIAVFDAREREISMGTLGETISDLFQSLGGADAVRKANSAGAP